MLLEQAILESEAEVILDDTHLFFTTPCGPTIAVTGLNVGSVRMGPHSSRFEEACDRFFGGSASDFSRGVMASVGIESPKVDKVDYGKVGEFNVSKVFEVMNQNYESPFSRQEEAMLNSLAHNTMQSVGMSFDNIKPASYESSFANAYSNSTGSVSGPVYTPPSLDCRVPSPQATSGVCVTDYRPSGLSYGPKPAFEPTKSFEFKPLAEPKPLSYDFKPLAEPKPLFNDFGLQKSVLSRPFESPKLDLTPKTYKSDLRTADLGHFSYKKPGLVTQNSCGFIDDFRCKPSDLLGKHGGGPHINLETYKPIKPRKNKALLNIHYPLDD